MRSCISLLVVLALAALVSSAFVPKFPRFVWNTTASTPVGLYIIVHGTPRRGNLALIDLPPNVRTLAVARGYLAPGSFLIKPVAAVSADRICRVGITVWVAGHKVAAARGTDAQRRLMPTWRGCRVLSSGQIAVLGVPTDSFDSRYFGPIDAGYMIGIAIPIWTVPTN